MCGWRILIGQPVDPCTKRSEAYIENQDKEYIAAIHRHLSSQFASFSQPPGNELGMQSGH